LTVPRPSQQWLLLKEHGFPPPDQEFLDTKTEQHMQIPFPDDQTIQTSKQNKTGDRKTEPPPGR